MHLAMIQTKHSTTMHNLYRFVTLFPVSQEIKVKYLLNALIDERHFYTVEKST